MKEDRYDKLLNAAIVLLLVSATVLGYSVYKSYFKPGSNTTASAKTAEQLRITKDSLTSDYANTVSKIDTNLNSTSSNSDDPVLKTKLAEMDVLKEEITTLLKSNGEADLVKARYKIEELKLKILLLENKYANAELENKKLQAIIDQLMAERGLNKKNAAGQMPLPTKEIRERAQQIYDDNKSKGTNLSDNEGPSKATATAATTSKALVNTATAMRLNALSVKNDTETETSKTSEANKLSGTFSIKLSNPKPSEDVFIVVIQPDGRTLKTSSWEAGVFSSDEGKKVFTKKIALDATTETQKINFSLDPDSSLTKGAYTMEIWHRTHLIGRSVRTFL